MCRYNGFMSRTIISSICIGCNCEFSVPLKSSTRPAPKYCSRHCFRTHGFPIAIRKAHSALAKKWGSLDGNKKPRLKKCEVCDSVIQSKPSKNQRFCSRRCSTISKNRNRKKPYPTVTCLQCLQIFLDEKFRNPKFCSRGCVSLYRKSHPEIFKKERGLRHCEFCGIDIDRPPSQKGRFCSYMCFHDWTVAKKVVRYPRSKMNRKKERTQICQQCGGLIDIRPSIKRKFCSRECSNLSQRGKPFPYQHSPESLGRRRGRGTLKWQRKYARRVFGNKCSRCGYDKIPEILQVHHKDHDPRNGDEENLELLCPNCHEEDHYNTKTGRFGKHERRPRIKREETYAFRKHASDVRVAAINAGLPDPGPRGVGMVSRLPE